MKSSIESIVEDALARVMRAAYIGVEIGKNDRAESDVARDEHILRGALFGDNPLSDRNNKKDAKKTASEEAVKLIGLIERNPKEILSWQDAEPMIELIGGSVKALKGCEHSATLCIYIAALMVRNQEQQK